MCTVNIIDIHRRYISSGPKVFDNEMVFCKEQMLSRIWLMKSFFRVGDPNFYQRQWRQIYQYLFILWQVAICPSIMAKLNHAHL